MLFLPEARTWSCLSIRRCSCGLMKTRSDQVEPLFSSSHGSQYPGNIDKSPTGEHGQKESAPLLSSNSRIETRCFEMTFIPGRNARRSRRDTRGQERAIK